MNCCARETLNKLFAIIASAAQRSRDLAKSIGYESVRRFAPRDDRFMLMRSVNGSCWLRVFGRAQGCKHHRRGESEAQSERTTALGEGTPQEFTRTSQTHSLLIDILVFIKRKAIEPDVRTAAEVLGARLKNLRFGE